MEEDGLMASMIRHTWDDYLGLFTVDSSTNTIDRDASPTDIGANMLAPTSCCFYNVAAK